MHNQKLTSDHEEFFQGFAWAIVTAFASSLNQCRFERGDILYDSPKGYERWDEALKHITFSLQVSYPPHSLGRASKKQDVFGDNWRSQIVFTVTNHKTKEIREVTSTQGRFYTLLWRGDWKILDAQTEPEVPLTCLAGDVCKLAEKAANEIKLRFCARIEKANLFLMAYDRTHPISSGKYEAVKRRLIQNFTVVEEMFAPYEVGLKDILIVPTVRFVAFAIEGDGAKVLEALKEALYTPTPGRLTDKDRFNIKAHGLFLPCPGLSDLSRLKPN